MDIQTTLVTNPLLIVFIVVAISALLLIVARLMRIAWLMFFRDRAARRPYKRVGATRVDATITEIQVEASMMSSWWTITATWSDPQTGQLLTFRSPHLQFRPYYRIGDRIMVQVDASRPKHYQMEL